MDQTLELQAVKRKIRGLLEKKPENGATEGEFMLAMKKVGELLLQYNLNMNEVLLREQPCVTKTFQSGSMKRDVLWIVSSGLAKFLGLKHWYTRWHDGIRWTFFGLEHDVEMALYLCDFIQKAEATAVKEFKGTDTYKQFMGNRKIASNSFKNGFGYNISSRLFEMAREAEVEERKAHEYHAQKAREDGVMIETTDAAKAEHARQTTGTALITLAKAKFIEEEFKKSGPKLRYTRSYSKARTHGGSYCAGAAAGARVNLGRPLGGRGGHKQIG